MMTEPETDPVQEEILLLVRQGRKIEAIKTLRERTGLELKESKEQVDELERTLAASAPDFKQQLEQRKGGCMGLLLTGLVTALWGVARG